MEKNYTYDVEKEHLDADGNVVDSDSVLITDNYEEALRCARDIRPEPNTQVAIWFWDEEQENVLDSEVITTA